jgi:hypothetical protein
MPVGGDERPVAPGRVTACWRAAAGGARRTWRRADARHPWHAPTAQELVLDRAVSVGATVKVPMPRRSRHRHGRFLRARRLRGSSAMAPRALPGTRHATHLQLFEGAAFSPTRMASTAPPNVAAVAYVRHPAIRASCRRSACSPTRSSSAPARRSWSRALGRLHRHRADLRHRLGPGVAGRSRRRMGLFLSIALICSASRRSCTIAILGRTASTSSVRRTRRCSRFGVLTLALALWGSQQDATTVFAFADITMGFGRWSI